MCSRDPNIAKLLSTYDADLVLAESSLLCLLDNHAPLFERQWEMPVKVQMVTRKGEWRAEFAATAPTLQILRAQMFNNFPVLSAAVCTFFFTENEKIKVVFVDKPFPCKNTRWRGKNHVFHKYALLSIVQLPQHLRLQNQVLGLGRFPKVATARMIE